MKWTSWFRRRRWERQMDAEFRFHLESLTADYVGQGLDRREAEKRARREFGSLDLAKDECRDQRPAEWFDQLLRDVRHGTRALRKNRGFAAAAIATMALGVGANAAIVSVVYSVLLKPLPYAKPAEIYSAELVIPERRDQFPSMPISVQLFLRWRGADTGFESIGALRPWEVNLTGDGEPERLGGARVSANFFSFLGVSPEHGRSFSADEETPGSERVVVISDALWRRRYGADAAVVGRSILINGEPHIVVGIAPPSLVVPTGTMLHPLVPFAARIDVWKPIAPTVGELKNESWDHGVLLRIPDGGNLEAGRARLEGILFDMVRAQMPGLETKATIRLVPIREIYAGRVRLRLLLILGAATLLLLTAGVSLTNLFLSRTASRSGEFATRIALGAGRMRIFTQVLTETALVSAAGGLLAAVLAYYGARVLVRFGPDDVRLIADTAFNLPLVAFSLAASLTTGLACGIAPAWQASRHGASGDLNDAGRSTLGAGMRTGRAHRWLVGVEMALGTLLLASSALLLHSFVNVMSADRGYQVDRILAVDVSLFGERYATRERRGAFYRDLVANVRALAGVEAAGAISDLPAMAGYADNTASRTLFLESDTDFRSQVLKRPVAMIRSVTPGYFSASGSPIKAGRGFAVDEPALAAMVSESLARRLWPGEPSALVVGRVFRQGDVQGPLIPVVGVVQDAQPGSVDREPPLTLYRPYAQWASGPMTVVVRTVEDPAVIAPAVRAEIRRLDPALPISAMRPLREIVAATVGPRRFQTFLTSVFAVLALVLGAVGLYGVVSYAVARRTREIGLRMALGAMRIDVMRWVVTSGMQPVLGGLVVGLVGAIAAARAVRGLLFGVSPVDPIALGAVVIVLLSASGLACYLPARRAAALDPTIALRHE